MMTHAPNRNGWLWLAGVLLLALTLVFFAKKITQLALPGFDVSPKTVVVDPQCPTPEQKEVIEPIPSPKIDRRGLVD